MNESSITIRWEENADGGTDISVSGDKDYLPHFKEAFLSLDTFPSVHSVDERETSGESAGNSATIALLTQLIAIIRKSDKTSGQIISEQMLNSKFPLTDLVAIRKFCEIAGIKFDEQKFRNRRGLQTHDLSYQCHLTMPEFTYWLHTKQKLNAGIECLNGMNISMHNLI